MPRRSKKYRATEIIGAAGVVSFSMIGKNTMHETLTYAMRLLARRDFSVQELSSRLEKRFNQPADDIIKTLVAKKFLNDRRFAENYVSRRPNRGRARLREELITRGVDSEIIDAVLSSTDWPSIQDAVKAKMVDWNLRAPLQSRDAARLFRALARLGYEEDAIREEITNLNDQ